MISANHESSNGADAAAIIPDYPWLGRLDRENLSTTRGFVFQFPPFSVLERSRPTDEPEIRPQGIYAHVPFCPYRCSYCYYAVEVNRSAGAIDHYLDALAVDMTNAAAQPAVQARTITTVFIGGGTPTYLNEQQFARLVDSMASSFDLGAVEEFSVEAEPTTVTPSKARALASVGVNRMSIGVQTFSDELNLLNHRRHTTQEVLDAIEAVRTAGIDNINLDLICGLIGETVDNWRRSINALIELQPEHITIYLFSLRPQTISFAQVNQHKVPLPPDDMTRIDMFRWSRGALLSAGYRQTSANCFVREPRFEQVHQRNAWSNLPLIGLGNSAYSYVDSRVTQNVRSVSEYAKRLSAGDSPAEIGRRLNSREVMIRYCVLRLKLLSIDRGHFHSLFGFDVTEILNDELAELKELGLITVDDARVSLTEQGIVYVDDACRRIYTPEVRSQLANAGGHADLLTSLV